MLLITKIRISRRYKVLANLRLMLNTQSHIKEKKIKGNIKHALVTFNSKAKSLPMRLGEKKALSTYIKSCDPDATHSCKYTQCNIAHLEKQWATIWITFKEESTSFLKREIILPIKVTSK